MTLSWMKYSWIHLIGEAMDMGFTLVLVQIGITVDIFLDEFKKKNPPTFDGEMKKS